jgi:hypothetical protein
MTFLLTHLQQFFKLRAKYVRKHIIRHGVTRRHCTSFRSGTKRSHEWNISSVLFCITNTSSGLPLSPLADFAFALGPIAIVYLFMPLWTRQLSNKAQQFIECGMDPIGDSWIRYGVVFYLYALIFLAFDVDVLFLFP